MTRTRASRRMPPIPVGHELLARLGANGRLTVARPSPQTVLFDLAGQINYQNSPQLQHELRAALTEQPRRVVINLARVAGVDSSAVATLLDTLTRAQAYGGSLRLVAPGEQILAVMALCQVADVFEVYPSEQEALAP